MSDGWEFYGEDPHYEIFRVVAVIVGGLVLAAGLIWWLFF